MGSTVYSCAFAVATLVAMVMAGEEVDPAGAVDVLQHARDIALQTEAWEKISNQLIMDPENKEAEPKTLKEMLKCDMECVQTIIGKMYAKVKAAIACRCYETLMPVLKLSTYAVVTIMANRDEAENAVRQVALEAAQKAPSIMTGMAAGSTKYMKTENQAKDFSVLSGLGDPEAALARGNDIVEKSWLNAENKVKMEAMEKEAKLEAAKAAQDIVTGAVRGSIFHREMLDKEQVRKTAEEKELNRTKYKRDMPPPVEEVPFNENDFDDIEALMDDFIAAQKPVEETDEVAKNAAIIERVAYREALKSRKQAVRESIASVKESIITTLDTMGMWTGPKDSAYGFNEQLKTKINGSSKSKIGFLNILKDEYLALLDNYSVTCNPNHEVTKIFQQFEKHTAAILSDDGDHSVDSLLANIAGLNEDLKADLERLPAEWKTFEPTQAAPAA